MRCRCKSTKDFGYEFFSIMIDRAPFTSCHADCSFLEFNLGCDETRFLIYRSFVASFQPSYRYRYHPIFGLISTGSTCIFISCTKSLSNHTFQQFPSHLKERQPINLISYYSNQMHGHHHLRERGITDKDAPEVE